MTDTKALFTQLKCCVIIPTYNNAGTVGKVIQEVLSYTEHLIVVNDGATDETIEILKNISDPVKVIHHVKNQGKGAALKTGFQYALSEGYDYAIAIDSDGQHFASDLPNFVSEIEKNPNTLVIGARNMEQENVPGKSNFGNKFSNFWYWVETGITLSDTQSGYRLYPIRELAEVKFFSGMFEFEIEIIVKAAWKGLNVKNIPISVHYEPGKKRISHFRPFQDFTRISILNSYLVVLALFYYLPIKFFRSLSREKIHAFLKKNLFDSSEPPLRKATSIGFGVFMGIFPIWGYQLIVGITLAHLMKMNKALFILAAHISIPPMIPFIIYGSYRLGGVFMTEPKNDILFTQGLSLEGVKDNLVQYLAGAVFLSVIAGIIAGVIAYGYLIFSSRLKNKTPF